MKNLRSLVSFRILTTTNYNRNGSNIKHYRETESRIEDKSCVPVFRYMATLNMGNSKCLYFIPFILFC